MTVPSQPVPESEPEPAVLEWGPQRSHRLARWRRIDPRIAPVFAGLGAVALFASLVSEWQVVIEPEWYLGPNGDEAEPLQLGLTVLVSWGAGWLVGSMLLATCAGLALLGPPPLRASARAIGLVGAGVLLAFLAAATVRLTQETLLFSITPGDVEIVPGRGVYAGYVGVLVIGLALWLTNPPVFTTGSPLAVTAPPALDEDPPEPSSSRYAGPADLTVAPTEPFAPPDQHSEGR